MSDEKPKSKPREVAPGRFDWFTRQRDYTRSEGPPVELPKPDRKRIEDEQLDILCSQIEAGVPPTTAATLAGINRATLQEWAKKAAMARADNEENRYTRRVARIEQASAKFEQTILSKVVAGVERDPKLGLEILRRRFPKNWAEPATRLQLSTQEMNDNELEARIAELSVHVKEHLLPASDAEIINTPDDDRK